MTDNLKDPHINDDADHLADAMRYWGTRISAAMYNSYQHAELKAYECDCSKCGFRYYTNIKQCNCPRCGCDGEHFRCTELK